MDVLNERISWKHSSNGKYVSVRIAFKADDRAQYDAAHEALRNHGVMVLDVSCDQLAASRVEKCVAVKRDGLL